MSSSKIRGQFTSLLLVLAVAAIAGIASGRVRSGTLPAPTEAVKAPQASPVENATTEIPTQTPGPSPAATEKSRPQQSATPTLETAGREPVISSPSATPARSEHPSETIGISVEGRPIVAYRFSDGPIKLVLVGNIHGDFEANTYVLAQELVAHFANDPGRVPATVSLWIIPTMNPDGLATGHRWNAHQVDLNRNSDTDLDGCAGNDWLADTVGHEGPHPGAGGPYPFSEPELRAIRDFLDDAWIAVLYHSAAEAIYLDSCQRHPPTARLAELLSDGTGYPVAEEGWVGYPISGDFGDYLAGQGVAAVTVELADHDSPELERNLAGVQTILAGVGEIVDAEADALGADSVWLDEGNTSSWRFPKNSFVHPLALEVIQETAFVLDGGRILALDLDAPAAARVLLMPGDEIQGTRVLEPVDLASDGSSLLALDRAGDVYRYDPSRTWSLERYDRPSRDTSDHYYVALDSYEGVHSLLETTREQVWRFETAGRGAPWVKLPKSRDVDLASSGADMYVLTRNLNGPRAELLRYRGASRIAGFAPNVEMLEPRQVRADAETVYVLDRAGRRLIAVDREEGALKTLYQFTDRREVGALWVDPEGGRMMLAGRDVLYFVGEPGLAAEVESGAMLDDPQPHDTQLLESLRGLQSPIDGSNLTSRDFQMPGAPRHYRLGVHEGIDFYGHTVGVAVNRHTSVRAVAEGEVVRALVDYQPPTRAQADGWNEESRQLGYTPDSVLDGYRGMQVWIEHKAGLVSKYAHLGSIAPDIVQGVHVTQGQVIGTVGNSGTPAALSSRTADVHLHLELWVGDHYIGQYLRPIETREWLGRILR